MHVYVCVCLCVYDNLCILSTYSYSVAFPFFDALSGKCESVRLGHSAVSATKASD